MTLFWWRRIALSCECTTQAGRELKSHTHLQGPGKLTCDPKSEAWSSMEIYPHNRIVVLALFYRFIKHLWTHYILGFLLTLMPFPHCLFKCNEFLYAPEAIFPQSFLLLRKDTYLKINMPQWPTQISQIGGNGDEAGCGWTDNTELADHCYDSGFNSEWDGSHWRVLSRGVTLFDLYFNATSVADTRKKKLGAK